MKLFLDNDIILKLSSAGLLKEIEEIFGANPRSIFILPTAWPYIARNKKLLEVYSADTITNALGVIADYSVIPDDYIDETRFFPLSNITGIDSGERILFSVNPGSEYLVITGDKRSIIALCSLSPEELKRGTYTEKIVCFEKIILLLLESNEFDSICGFIINSGYCGDKVLKIVFGQAKLNVESVQTGLNSYYNDLKGKTDGVLF